MDTMKKDKIRKVVEDIMRNKVESLIDDIFMDNQIRDEVLDNIPHDVYDEEVSYCLHHNDDGEINSECVDNLIETLTDGFMGRFE